MPEVSIITPCYNSSKFLQQTVDSVLNQTFTDWEWLITDDKSTDNSVEIIRKVNDVSLCTGIIPNNRTTKWTAGFTTPSNSSLALIGYASRKAVIY